MTRKLSISAGFVAAAVGLAFVAIPGGASATEGRSRGHVHAHLTELNNSGVSGIATVDVRGRRLNASIFATGLLPNAPHAVHIHFGETALHECPTQAADGGDGKLTTSEGLPFYGPVVVAFTLFGDTSAASTLAVDRFDTTPSGVLDYHRDRIKTQRSVAKAVARGEGVVVIHGVDYNGNGFYDFEAAGASDLDPTLAAEATDLAACGVLND